jgi:RNA polymerase sigma factor (sigma-70 family)
MKLLSLDRSSVYDFYKRWMSKKDYRATIEKIARKNTRATTASWEEAAQNAYLKIWQAVLANKFQHGGEQDFLKWSAVIARRTAIDFCSHECLRQHISLDATLPNTNTPILDTIADTSNLSQDFEQEYVEQEEEILKINVATKRLDEQYPNKGYLELLEAKKQGKNQTQIANELKVKQGTISKRWKELTKALRKMLEAQKLQEDLRTETYDRSNLY